MNYARLARRTAGLCGRPAALALATGFVLVWALSGPLFGWSDGWQLVCNTVTNVVTFLMVFLIQTSQDRDTAAIQLKLDELIRATAGAHDALLDLEELDEAAVTEFRAHYARLAREARARRAEGGSDTGTEE